MSLLSMTGFARTPGEITDSSWTWEIRSVNGKGLDLRLRLPAGFDALEARIRKAAAERFSRGNLQMVLILERSSSEAVPTLNEAALESTVRALEIVQTATKTSPSTAAQILSLRGVMELSEPRLDEAQQQELETQLFASAKQALDELKNHRAQEGQALSDILLGHLQTIEDLQQRAEADPASSLESIKARLSEQISKLIDDSTKLDQDRLHQEAALLATKADIREELDRLIAHVAAGRDLLSQGSPAGRKLEFLAQELNRETNTLCSKSNSVSLTEIGLEMKVVIDQFREQILNVE